MLQCFHDDNCLNILAVELFHGFPQQQNDSVHLVDACLMVHKLPEKVTVFVAPSCELFHDSKSAQGMLDGPCEKTKLKTATKIKKGKYLQEPYDMRSEKAKAECKLQISQTTENPTKHSCSSPSFGRTHGNRHCLLC